MEHIFLKGYVVEKPKIKESTSIPKGKLGNRYWEYKIDCENDLVYGENEMRIHAIYTVIDFDTSKDYKLKKGQEVTVSGRFAARMFLDKKNEVHIKLFAFETYDLCYNSVAADILIGELCEQNELSKTHNDN